jgi:hypothetical protein
MYDGYRGSSCQLNEIRDLILFDDERFASCDELESDPRRCRSMLLSV